MKKIISLLLCLAMMAALCACGGTSIESYGDAAEPVAEVPENEAPGFSAYPADTVVGTVNGEEITWMEYFYFINEYAANLQQLAASYGVALTAWNANDVSSTDTNETVVMLNAQYAVTQHHAVQDKAEELGISLDEEELAMLREVFETNADQGLGDADGICTEEEIAAFEAYLAERNVDRAFFDFLNEITLLVDKLYLNTYGQAGLNYPDEEVAAFAEANGLMAAKHILLLTKDMTTGETLSEEEIASQKALAEDILSQLQAVEGNAGETSGEPTALVELFDQLTAEYTEDTGYAANPDGYIFGDGQMVAEFENAVKALGEYGLSDIVESSYGYHIVLRIPVDPDGVLGTDSYGNEVTLRNQASSNAFSADLAAWMDEAEVIWNEGFEAMDLAALLG